MKDSLREDTHTRKLLQKYLAETGVGSLDNILQEANARILFKAFVHDFLDYQISVDDLSNLCEQLWTLLRNQTGRRLSILAGNCMETAELEWYMRNNPVEGGRLVEDILNYYYSIGGKRPRQPADSKYPDKLV